jgi:hypothetical protein
MNRRLWIWRHFRLRLPADWEMLQFTRNPAVGRCAFADRYAFRLEMNWRAVGGPPDFDLMLRDYTTRLREQGHEHLRPVRRAGWRGVVGERQGLALSRFGAYFDEASCLVELVFIWPEMSVDRSLEQTVLESVGEEPPDAAGRRRWRAFGMDVHVHGGLSPARCRVLPGEVDWVFEATRGRPRVRVRRIGLRPLWMRQGVDAWLRANAPPLRGARGETMERQGHALHRWSGRLRTGGLERLTRGPRDYWAEAWVCPADDRLYAREIQGPSVFAAEEGRGGSLRCTACGEEDA